jgi:hypothetical protein
MLQEAIYRGAQLVPASPSDEPSTSKQGRGGYRHDRKDQFVGQVAGLSDRWYQPQE